MPVVYAFLALVHCKVGDTVKLRGHPKGLCYTYTLEIAYSSKNARHAGVQPALKMDNPQPSPKKALMLLDAVHRLDVGGGLLRLLRYSRASG